MPWHVIVILLAWCVVSISLSLPYSPSSLSPSLFVCGCVCVERREAQSESVSEIAQTEQTSHQTFLFTFDERECAYACVYVCMRVCKKLVGKC